MMNPIIQSLFDRKSCRIFKDKEISQEDKTLILQAAMQAPSAGNQQMYTIIDVQDKKLQETLSKTCDNQSFINQAKMVLIFCADFQKWYDLFSYENCNPRKPGVGDLLLATTDATIAAQNAVVAAESLGIGSCYIGDILEQHDLHRKLLNLSEYVVPVCMLVLGYPAEDHFKRQKPERCQLEDIVCVNQYHRKDKQELKNMFDHKAGNKTLNEWATAFCKRKYNSDFSKEMTNSVQKYIDQFKSEAD